MTLDQARRAATITWEALELLEEAANLVDHQVTLSLLDRQGLIRFARSIQDETHDLEYQAELDWNDRPDPPGENHPHRARAPDG